MIKLPYTTDAGVATCARLGLIVLQTDETIEYEFSRLMSIAGVALHYTRIKSASEVTTDSLLEMKQHLTSAAQLLPSVAFDVVGYACTSGATVIGSAQIATAIRQARAKNHPENFQKIFITNPLDAVILACQKLGVKKLAFITPYIAEVSLTIRQALEQAGLTISIFASFVQSNEKQVARISSHSISESIIKLNDNSRDYDAFFISCTNLRTLEIIPQLEQKINKPILSSNCALGWQMLRQAGVDTLMPQYGRLFALSPS